MKTLVVQCFLPFSLLFVSHYNFCFRLSFLAFCSFLPSFLPSFLFLLFLISLVVFIMFRPSFASKTKKQKEEYRERKQDGKPWLSSSAGSCFCYFSSSSSCSYFSYCSCFSSAGSCFCSSSGSSFFFFLFVFLACLICFLNSFLLLLLLFGRPTPPKTETEQKTRRPLQKRGQKNLLPPVFGSNMLTPPRCPPRFAGKKRPNTSSPPCFGSSVDQIQSKNLVAPEKRGKMRNKIMGA